MNDLIRRPRRNRKNSAIRNLVKEHSVSVDDLIAPLFVVEGDKERIPISSMPGYFRLSIDELIKEAKELHDLGISGISLFPVIEESKKSKRGDEAINSKGLYLRAIKAVKEAIPEMLVMSDVALDPYSTDGHDGIVDDKTGEIINDVTLEILGEMSICQAKSGADIIGPSDMMDGRVGYIRGCLDKSGFENVSIMSYTAKYASSFYGPFRDALDSTPKRGDKKTYQLDFANDRDALIEAELDELEGADILMVKPGLVYLDILAKMKNFTHLPLAVYNVSGEYAMVKAAAEKGWLEEASVVNEMMYAFKRAGADIILTYFAKDIAFALSNR